MIPVLTQLWTTSDPPRKAESHFFLIGGKLLYNFVLVSVVQQRELVINIYISPPSTASVSSPHHTFQVIPQCQARLPVQYSSLHQPSILHMIVYIRQYYSPNSSYPLLHLLYPHSVLYICISIPSLQIGSSVPFFLDAVYRH